MDDAKADALRRSGLYWSTLTTRERMTASAQNSWAKFKRDVLTRWREGFFDRFRPIREAAGDSAYMNARLSTDASSTMYATLLYGAPQWQAGIIGKKSDTWESSGARSREAP